jgi:3-oxoacyl-[acyl-carrier-protein] synthase III
LKALKETRLENVSVTSDFPLGSPESSAHTLSVIVASSGGAVGSRLVPSEGVDQAFGMPNGKLRKRAGIESLAYAVEGEDEITLGVRSAQQALQRAGCRVEEVDAVIAAGETFRGYPSLAAQLHPRLLVREDCAAFDVGGACLGLLNALAMGQALIVSGQAKTVLVVTADVHSRTLTPQTVAGEFGGLFGDGSSAFVLRRAENANAGKAYGLGQFRFGCAGQYAGAVRIADLGARQLDVHFDGEALSRAAITRLEKVIGDIELRSRIPRASLLGLATHQPNPRLVTLLAKQCGLPEEKLPAVSRKYGNLGSSTCGFALHLLLQGERPAPPAGILLASLGPGLLFGGGWLAPV